jgi:hypothetical protein
MTAINTKREKADDELDISQSMETERNTNYWYVSCTAASCSVNIQLMCNVPSPVTQHNYQCLLQGW